VRNVGSAAPCRRAPAPRAAFLGPAETIPVADAVGRVSAESIAGYPPGIPALLPGERITTEMTGHVEAVEPRKP
jgi:arginine decarboxylase